MREPDPDSPCHHLTPSREYLWIDRRPAPVWAAQPIDQSTHVRFRHAPDGVLQLVLELDAYPRGREAEAISTTPQVGEIRVLPQA